MSALSNLLIATIHKCAKEAAVSITANIAANTAVDGQILADAIDIANIEDEFRQTLFACLHLNDPYVLNDGEGN